MKYIQLNNTDLDVSRICLGTAGFGDKLDQEKSFEVLDAFIRAGGNFIDTANVYCKWLEAAVHWEKMRLIFIGFTEMIRKNRWKRSWIFWKN